MSRPWTIALDAMGGDLGPRSVIVGAADVSYRYPDARFLIFGDEAKLAPLMRKVGRLKDRAEIRHTTGLVGPKDKPSHVLRRGSDTSMGRAIHAVVSGEADGVVSNGNTGALMALSMYLLKTLPGVDRPAIASLMPTSRGEVIMLDLGANVECDARNLTQFAMMGAHFAHAVLGRQKPLVGLLNVGVEETKGRDAIRQAADILRQNKDLPLEFHGFVEGGDINQGVVDVVVTDGFTGNVALKTMEGTARMIGGYLRAVFRRSLLTKLSYLIAQGAIDALRQRLDPRYYNGGVFLGLNGIVVKSHGGADSVAFASALELAIDMVADDLPARTARDVGRFFGSGDGNRGDAEASTQGTQAQGTQAQGTQAQGTQAQGSQAQGTSTQDAAGGGAAPAAAAKSGEPGAAASGETGSANAGSTNVGAGESGDGAGEVEHRIAGQAV
ncbi:phosphate acyltransferase PlsX [Marinibaculum pumilum]|uniref:Phosphate acyltransferase n=1 Tax=Marinibaculum pumilum TaxID=1766165 RepID=A0ABV7KU26_9PROT